MVRERETRATGADTEAVLLFTALGAVILVVGGVWVSLHTAAVAGFVRNRLKRALRPVGGCWVGRRRVVGIC